MGNDLASRFISFLVKVVVARKTLEHVEEWAPEAWKKISKVENAFLKAVEKHICEPPEFGRWGAVYFRGCILNSRRSRIIKDYCLKGYYFCDHEGLFAGKVYRLTDVIRGRKLDVGLTEEELKEADEAYDYLDLDDKLL